VPPVCRPHAFDFDRSWAAPGEDGRTSPLVVLDVAIGPRAGELPMDSLPAATTW
jgi:hypothetical protein